MDKAKKIIAIVSLCIVAVCGALLNSHQVPGAEKILAIVVTVFGALGHVLPQALGGTSQPVANNVVPFPKAEDKS